MIPAISSNPLSKLRISLDLVASHHRDVHRIARRQPRVRVHDDPSQRARRPARPRTRRRRSLAGRRTRARSRRGGRSRRSDAGALGRPRCWLPAARRSLASRSSKRCASSFVTVVVSDHIHRDVRVDEDQPSAVLGIPASISASRADSISASSVSISRARRKVVARRLAYGCELGLDVTGRHLALGSAQ